MQQSYQFIHRHISYIDKVLLIKSIVLLAPIYTSFFWYPHFSRLFPEEFTPLICSFFTFLQFDLLQRILFEAHIKNLKPKQKWVNSTAFWITASYCVYLLYFSWERVFLRSIVVRRSILIDELKKSEIFNQESGKLFLEKDEAPIWLDVSHERRVLWDPNKRAIVTKWDSNISKNFFELIFGTMRAVQYDQDLSILKKQFRINKIKSSFLEACLPIITKTDERAKVIAFNCILERKFRFYSPAHLEDLTKDYCNRIWEILSEKKE